MISVIIPTYNRGAIFYQCLSSVLQSIQPEDEVIVVNDYKLAAIDLSSIDLCGKSVHVYDNPKQGVASARNYGASFAKGDILLFVDDDMIINEHAVKSTKAYVNQNDSSIVMANWEYSQADVERLSNTSFGRYLLSIGFNSLKGWNNGLEWSENSYVFSPGITSQYLMLKKNIFELIGRYNEDFPYAGFEDGALYNSIKEKGIICVVDTHCKVVHNELDRLKLLPFLERKYRGAITRKIGVKLGHEDFTIHYSWVKKIYFSFLSRTKKIWLKLLILIPNHKSCDIIYRLIVNRLVGTYIFEGYHKIK